jgi:hypothetical protein
MNPRTYDVQVKTYDIACDDLHTISLVSYAMMYDIERLYDIVLTYDIVDYDVVRSPRTTSYFDIARRVRTISYVYDGVRHDVRFSSPRSVIRFGIIRYRTLTSDV